MNANRAELRATLVEPGYITIEEFEKAEKIALTREEDIIDILIDQGLIKDSEYGQLIAQKLGLPFVNLNKEKIDDKVLNMIPEPLSRARSTIVFARDKNCVKVAMNDPGDLVMRHLLSKKTGARIKVYYATERDINSALWQYRSSLKEEVKSIVDRIKVGESKYPENNTRIVDLTDTILMHAQNSLASDIHIEPYISRAVVRFRIDGVMHQVAQFPKNLLPFIIARIKIMANMKIDEHLSAQDGKFQYESDGEKIDVRVSIVPVSGGENVVLRLLSKKNRLTNLGDLGLGQKDLDKIKRAIAEPHGMVLVTGPTGSGKTTTVYEMIKMINSEKVHIATIEDPVEYNIEGISQIQVNNKAKLSFASGLRAIVRQDPDIIMVGEIRDKETASIAVNSAMTGHLVLSTLHTNDAATALPRLFDMEVEAFLIASTVNVIIAQRLLRLTCSKCRYSYSLSADDLRILEIVPHMKKRIEDRFKKSLEEMTWYKGSGCKSCSGSGYKGRTGIYEVLKVDDEIKRLILKRASSGDINNRAREGGMTTMLDDGIEKAANGLTTLDEVIRVIME